MYAYGEYRNRRSRFWTGTPPNSIIVKFVTP